MFGKQQMSTRFKICLSYKGTSYSGFQRQPGKHTIQKVVEESLFKILREKIVIHSTGRTDKGVHALAQWIHFDISESKALERAQDNSFKHRLNEVLPEDIKVVSFTQTTKEFHARKSAKEKIYTYWLCFTDKASPFANEFCWSTKTLDLKLMKKAAKPLIGEHNFSAFCASDSCVKSKTRTLHKISFKNSKSPPFLASGSQKYIQIEFVGNGFLKQMVRNIVGTLVDVGLHKTHPDQVQSILQSKDRKKAGPTAPAKGLFLKTVRFK